MKSITESVTEEFLEVMEKPENQTGVAAEMVGCGFLPEGVDPHNDRVKEVVRSCQERNGMSTFLGYSGIG